MAHDDQPSPAERLARLRRPPPPFRTVAVRRVVDVSRRLRRVVLGGGELAGFEPPEPAASVRLLLPGPDGLVIPEWTGNEFLLADGSRPLIRTMTPRRYSTAENELTVDFVVHGEGAASGWAQHATPGAPVAVSGPGRGYAIDDDAERFLLAGDETAIPAMSQLLEVLPEVPVQVLVEVAGPGARHPLPDHPRAAVAWLELGPGDPPGALLGAAVAAADIGATTAVWVAGEAAAVQRIRSHLFEERGLPRSRATVRGYWKHGRAAGGDAD